MTECTCSAKGQGRGRRNRPSSTTPVRWMHGRGACLAGRQPGGGAGGVTLHGGRGRAVDAASPRAPPPLPPSLVVPPAGRPAAAAAASTTAAVAAAASSIVVVTASGRVRPRWHSLRLQSWGDVLDGAPPSLPHLLNAGGSSGAALPAVLTSPIHSSSSAGRCFWRQWTVTGVWGAVGGGGPLRLALLSGGGGGCRWCLSPLWRWAGTGQWLPFLCIHPDE